MEISLPPQDGFHQIHIGGSVLLSHVIVVQVVMRMLETLMVHPLTVHTEVFIKRLQFRATQHPLHFHSKFQ